MNTRACPYCSKPMIPGTLGAEWCHGLSFRPHSVTPQDEHSPRDFETFYVCKSLFSTESPPDVLLLQGVRYLCVDIFSG